MHLHPIYDEIKNTNKLNQWHRLSHPLSSFLHHSWRCRHILWKRIPVRCSTCTSSEVTELWWGRWYASCLLTASLRDASLHWPDEASMSRSTWFPLLLLTWNSTRKHVYCNLKNVMSRYIRDVTNDKYVVHRLPCFMLWFMRIFCCRHNNNRLLLAYKRRVTVWVVPRSRATATTTMLKHLTSAAEEDGRCQAKSPRVVFQRHPLYMAIHGHDDRLVFIQHQYFVPSESTTNQHIAYELLSR